MITALDFVLLRLNKNRKAEVLLYKRQDGIYTIIGGQIFDKGRENGFPPDHDINSAIKRILLNKVGIEINNLEQINQVFGSRDRDSRGWSVSIPFCGFVSAEESDALELSENHRWVSVNEILDKANGEYTHKLPFDHNELVSKVMLHIHRKIGYSSSVLYALPKKFKISDITSAYAAFGLSVSRQTVHNRIVGNGCIVAIKDENEPKSAGKPAQIFMLYEKEITYFDICIGKKIN
ncbi:NUDIX hydrolase [Photobacterium kishitanii]|uniref:NUDIX hydrolase n=1 Tax=Photobacterium kishitanii TaxID=318456 RepID=A0A2T3KLY1_9GAMM|nr:NUDIX hydrolase [Photobacterium kishitanii]PSV00650.1 hypothetical protein C9J27_05795 [Photobacterium kishitanii]